VSFTEEIEEGWKQPPRGDQINVWSAEVSRCAAGLDEHRQDMKPEVIGFLRDLFYEIGRLCRDAER
jgi:hypothetical protein